MSRRPLSPFLAFCVGVLCLSHLSLAHAAPQAPLPENLNAAKKLDPANKPDFSHLYVDHIEVRDTVTPGNVGVLTNGPDGKTPLSAGVYLPVPLKANATYMVLVVLRNNGPTRFNGTVSVAIEVRAGVAQPPVLSTSESKSIVCEPSQAASNSFYPTFTTQAAGRYWFKVVRTP